MRSFRKHGYFKAQAVAFMITNLISRIHEEPMEAQGTQAKRRLSRRQQAEKYELPTSPGVQRVQSTTNIQSRAHTHTHTQTQTQTAASPVSRSRLNHILVRAEGRDRSVCSAVSAALDTPTGTVIHGGDASRFKISMFSQRSHMRSFRKHGHFKAQTVAFMMTNLISRIHEEPMEAQ